MNSGVYPIDPLTPIGQLRVNVGDTGFTLENGYANFSDADLQVCLELSNGDINRATGNAYMRLAATYAALGRTVKTDDLGLDTRGRSADLLEIAREWFARAAEADRQAAGAYIDIVSPSRPAAPFFI